MTDRTGIARLRVLIVVLLVAAGLAAAHYASAGTVDDIPISCGTDNPFFAAALFSDDATAAGDNPALVAFRDTSTEVAEDRLVLARQTDVGSVFGLAADPAGERLFAAAYYRHASEFGPGGPGAIYAVDLTSGAVTLFATVDAGPDRHLGAGAGGDRWIGISSLGDMALSHDGRTLFVANLFRGRIDRISAADGTFLGSLRHGAGGETWSSGARLFGLAYHEGALYHAVVDSGAVTMDGIPTAHIYRSAPDGTGMESLAVVPLDAWETWADGPSRVKQPMAVALDFDAGGRLVLGVRNRIADMAEANIPAAYLNPAAANVGGEVMWLDAIGGDWVAGRSASSGGRGRFLSGGIAAMPGLDITVAAGDAAQMSGTTADVAVWFNLPGLAARDELLRIRQGTGRRPAPEGGVEPLCARTGLDEGLAATSTVNARATQVASATAAGTSLAGSATAAATVAAGTQTARSATRAALPSDPAATATAAVAHLSTIQRSCGSSRPYFAVTCFAQDVDLQALASEPAIVAFNGTDKIPLAGQLDVGATFGLAHDLSRNHLYAAAYLKRGAPFGPAGPGGVYRIDLNTGAVDTFATLHAGPDPHSGIGDLDRGASAWTGRASLGDIEVDDWGSTLFVMNLFDQNVHRYALDDGRYLGSFSAPLGGGGHPFGLGFRAGWLYMGVVSDAGPTGHVFRSRPDGSQMEEVFNFSLAYGHVPAWIDWSPPQPVDSWNSQSAEAMLTDIEFGPTGDILLGLRDRVADATIFNAGSGDVLPARREPTGWRVVTQPEFYAENNIHDEPAWGGLALAPSRNVTVATVLDPIVISSGGIEWFDNETGAVVDEQTIYVTAGNSPTFSKAAGLGDLEGLCPNPDVPTPEPTYTYTPVPTSTLTPSATPTRVPSPIYLPVVIGEHCRDRTRHADIVLVLDVSTSMLRPSGQGRPKLEAMQDAARTFVRTVDFTPNDEGGHDQVSIVAFNNTARVVQSLSSDREELLAAVDRLPEQLEQGTRLDLALSAGADAFADERRTADNAAVLVLLTDGVPNRVPTPVSGGSPEDTVLVEADAAKRTGIEIYTIGVGRQDAPDPADRINVSLLRSVASRPDMFYQAPDAEELERIYLEVAVTIACPRGRHKWGEPWP